MKTILGSLLLLCATSAFSQSVTPSEAQPLQMNGNPQHASQHAMAQESSLFGSSTYSYAKGEIPLAELGSPIPYVPLGDLARQARKEHANDRKAARTLEK
jgi:hypothetical protein